MNGIDDRRHPLVKTGAIHKVHFYGGVMPYEMRHHTACGIDIHLDYPPDIPLKTTSNGDEVTCDRCQEHMLLDGERRLREPRPEKPQDFDDAIWKWQWRR